jgi:hypothetical protein
MLRRKMTNVNGRISQNTPAFVELSSDLHHDILVHLPKKTLSICDPTSSAACSGRLMVSLRGRSAVVKTSGCWEVSWIYSCRDVASYDSSPFALHRWKHWYGDTASRCISPVRASSRAHAVRGVSWHPSEGLRRNGNRQAPCGCSRLTPKKDVSGGFAGAPYGTSIYCSEELL